MAGGRGVVGYWRRWCNHIKFKWIKSAAVLRILLDSAGVGERGDSWMWILEDFDDIWSLMKDSWWILDGFLGASWYLIDIWLFMKDFWWILIDSEGFLWILRDSWRFCWYFTLDEGFLMDNWVILEYLIDIWLLMEDSYGLLWILVDSCGFFRIFSIFDTRWRFAEGLPRDSCGCFGDFLNTFDRWRILGALLVFPCLFVFCFLFCLVSTKTL